MIITNKILNQKIENSPSRFDMAICFYCCLKIKEKYYLVAYDYNPAWNLYFPFYDDLNKTPVLQESKATTYGELIDETNKTLNINLDEKLNLAKKRFKELLGCNCTVKPSKINEMFELKHSKSTDIYSIYKFYNFILTDVENLNLLLNPCNLKCELFEIENLENTNLASNAIAFTKKSINELKENAIKWNNMKKGNL